MKILHLTLKKQWFDMILSGVKREEYREIKPYWGTRLKSKEYDVIEFRNGYSSDARRMTVECKGISQGFGNREWGAPAQKVYVIELGDILTKNTQCVQ